MNKLTIFYAAILAGFVAGATNFGIGYAVDLALENNARKESVRMREMDRRIVQEFEEATRSRR